MVIMAERFCRASGQIASSARQSRSSKLGAQSLQIDALRLGNDWIYQTNLKTYLQGGLLIVITGVINPVNGLING